MERSSLLFDVFGCGFAVHVQFLCNCVVLAAEDFNPVLLGIVFFLSALHLILSRSKLLFKSILFVVEFILQSQEVFVERDTVSEERFIAGSLVLLVDFSVFKELYFCFHGCDLFLKVVNVVELKLVTFGAFGLLALATLVPVVVAFEI